MPMNTYNVILNKVMKDSFENQYLRNIIKVIQLLNKTLTWYEGNILLMNYSQ